MGTNVSLNFVSSAIMNVSGFIKQHPVLTFYALTFAISWGGIQDALALILNKQKAR